MLKSALRDFISLIYPHTCFACKRLLVRGEKFICTHCHYKLPVTDYHQNPDNELQRRFWGKVPLKYTFAYLHFVRGGRVQKLLHNLKYGNAPGISEFLGNNYGRMLMKSGYKGLFDLVTAVPLHPAKLRKRGYNQSEGFAKGISVNLGAAFSTSVLRRTVATSTQTKKNRMARWKNVETVFAPCKGIDLKEQRVLIIDDVLTTGSTLEACANVLLANGCKEVSIAVIAAAA
ncbi:MAG: competence protein [Bacteroidetes bacterium RIFCSPLOWO2_02_FULL_36_8]|nr:MAG: competence protein [Bacteroidetes bacterium RIFCSPLOWO2_02_FULL_36_8]OFY68808.1 MAG: competence protein [Bacteroidetes bacterium RIFCSPLOWO2_12_FULL_37_12]